ncbi:MAG: DNA primase [Mycoplasma sp.]|nr:DNA primase [Mycoplasma sp.]
MSKYNNNLSSLIEDIRNSTNIVDVISHYISLKKKGSSYFGLCPFHPDTHPSLSISPKKKIFKCFVCGTKGDVFSFVSKYEKISYLQAVKKVAELTNYDLGGVDFSTNNQKALSAHDQRLVDANVRANEFYTGILYNDENKNILEYLKNRGLNDELIKKFGIGYAVNNRFQMIDWLTNKDQFFGNNLPANKVFNLQELFDAGIATESNNNHPIAFLIDRITFPIYDENNNLVGFSGRDWTGKQESKYSNTKETKIFKKGEVLYNFNHVRTTNKDFVIICEGFMDAIAYTQAGYDNVLATMGTAVTTRHISLLQTLENMKYIILSFDNDQAGSDANISIGKQLFENGLNVSVVTYQNYKEKDVDEILRAHGKAAVDDLIKNRTDFLTYKIIYDLPLNMSNDEKIIRVGNLLKYLSEYGDTLLHDMHLDLISQRTKLAKDSLKLKLNEFIEVNKNASSGGVNFTKNKPIVNKQTKSTAHQKSEIQFLYQQIQACISQMLIIILSNPKLFDLFSKRVNISKTIASPEQDKIYRLYKNIISSNPIISSNELFNELTTTIERKIKDKNLSKEDIDVYKNAIKLLTTYMYDVEENQNVNYEREIDSLIYNFTIKSYQFLIQDKINKIKKLEQDQTESKPIDVVKLSELTKQLSELKNNFKKFRQK